jgi:hypothetical protein
LIGYASLHGPKNVLLGEHSYAPAWRLGSLENSSTAWADAVFKGRFYVDSFDSLPVISADRAIDVDPFDFLGR